MTNVKENYGTPLVDILENDQEYLFCFDLPGVPANQISVDLGARQLSLVAKREEDSANPTFNVVYKRCIELPNGVNRNDVKSHLKDGILTIQLPKSEAVKPRRIEVKTT